LDEMESERLISRRQGRGTFVIDQASEECATRFSNLRDASGARIIGEVESCEVEPASASEEEARHLKLRGGEGVFRVHRLRSHNGEPFMVEDATVPQSRFPGLAEEADISPTIIM